MACPFCFSACLGSLHGALVIRCNSRIVFLLYLLSCSTKLNLMRRFFLLLGFILFGVTSSFSQSRLSVVGYVSDTTGKKPVEFAAVAFLSSRDSIFIASAVTDINGVFELRGILPGKYLIQVSHMSFNSTFKRVSVRGGEDVFNVGNIRMVRKQIALNEIVVTGKSTPIRIAKDTLEFNAGAYRPREQDVVADVLRKLPGVTVDKDGAITINGKQVTQIMVDGKKFFLNDPSLATQNLPADIIDKIQVVNKKSDQAEFTKVDDGNTEKVINLTLKKEKKRGFFGSYRAGAGTNDSYDFGARVGGFEDATQLVTLGGYNNINRQGGAGSVAFPNPTRQGILTAGNAAVTLNCEPSAKLQINGSYRFGYGNSDRETTSNRQNFDSRGTFNSDSYSNGDSYNRSHSLYTQFEYKMDTILSAIVTPNIQIANGNSRDFGNSHLFDANGALVNSEERNSLRNAESHSYGMGILLQKQLKHPRQTLSVNVESKMGDSNSDVLNFQKNYYAVKDSTNIRNQSVAGSGRNGILSSNFAYTHPWGRYLTAEVNYRFQWTNVKSTNNAFDYDPSTQKYDVKDDLYSKSYRNSECSNSAGLFLNFANGRLVANAGANVNVVNQDYQNRMGNVWLDTALVFRYFSPSMMLSYNPDEGHDVSFRYNGSNRQPSVEQLHPVQNPNTPNSIMIGNPTLKQEFSHSFSLSYSYFNKETFLSFSNSLSSSITCNAIAGKSFRDELGKYYLQAVNVNGFYRLGNFTSVGKSVLANKLHLSASVNVDYSHTPGFFNLLKYYSTQLGITGTWKAYLTLDFLEVGADCSYSENSVRYEGISESILSMKMSNRYSSLSLEGSITARLPANFEVCSTLDASRRFGDLYGSSDDSYLWNAAVTKKFLRDKSLALSIMAYDILNRYRPFARNVTATYIEEVKYKAMSQLFMVTLSYSLNKFGAKKG